MRILFVASELAPFAKMGGLGDVVGSLPKALSKLGLDVSVVIPFYESVKKSKWPVRQAGQYFFSGQRVRVLTTTLPRSSVPVFFLENQRYLSKGSIYFDRSAFMRFKKEFDRFSFFSQAVGALLVQGVFGKVGIIHCHDWHSGALVAMLRNKKLKISPSKIFIQKNLGGQENQNLRTIFTIHNLANQGVWRKFNPMAEGIKNADLVTTVSPSYAKEILTKKFGNGLEELLRRRAREKKFIGILNGIDYRDWPLEGRNKISFQKRLKLKQGNQIPLFGLVARLTYQKGIHLITAIVEDMVKKFGAQFVFLGQGSAIYENSLRKLLAQYPSHVFAKIGFDETLARHIYAESDFFLMPSLFEPSGLGQMISMHYGTIPIVHAVGGLKDSVRHLKTGIVFQEFTSAALKKSLIEALDYFFQRPAQLRLMRANAEKQDFSWDKSARRYKDIYRKLGVGL